MKTCKSAPLICTVCENIQTMEAVSTMFNKEGVSVLDVEVREQESKAHCRNHANRHGLFMQY